MAPTSTATPFHIAEAISEYNLFTSLMLLRTLPRKHDPSGIYLKAEGVKYDHHFSQMEIVVQTIACAPSLAELPFLWHFSKCIRFCVVSLSASGSGGQCAANETQRRSIAKSFMEHLNPLFVPVGPPLPVDLDSVLGAIKLKANSRLSAVYPLLPERAPILSTSGPHNWRVGAVPALPPNGVTPVEIARPHRLDPATPSDAHRHIY
ncbi:unnamed protein product, partial [Iphiclides podalirius]